MLKLQSCMEDTCAVMYTESTCGELWSRLQSDGIDCTMNHSEYTSIKLMEISVFF